MIAGGTVRHSTLGVAGVALSERFVRDAELGVETTAGFCVTAVRPAGPADRAGIRAPIDPVTGAMLPNEGDIIVSFGGEPVENVRQLRERIDAREVNETVEIGLIREGEPVMIQVTLDAFTPAGR